jgi:hypothetical protein
MCRPDLTPGPDLPETLKQSIIDILNTGMALTGVTDIKMKPEFDYSGYPVIMVRINHKRVKRPIKVAELMRVEGDARDHAWAHGEQRFLSMHHDYARGQEIV